ncbi:MAG: hypothetical protein N3D84_02370 [Candidatus Woesearchaeota archaeon]|nr:hypothetical protein [Candidatus Woesearchaeota archaeon]
MKAITKILFFVLVLLALCFVGCQKVSEETNEEEGISYISEEAVTTEPATQVKEKETENKTITTTAEESKETKNITATVIETKSAETKPIETAKTAEGAAIKASPNEITVYEGELVEIKVKGYDPDGDKITYKFSAPLDENGKWQTKTGDAGVYDVKITASDGKTETTKSIKIKVLSKNNPPVMEKIADITVREGDVITLSPKVLDPDGDQVTIKYSGWMSSATYKTGYNDAGEHIVTVTASDGKLETSQNVKITVTDVNRAPEFEIVIS